MEDVNISKFRAQVVRAGSTPASPGFVVSEGQNPVDPSGSGQNHLPVTIATAATGLSITESQVLGGAGTVGQYIRGDGSLADFPATTGGGSSVSYYLNGSVSQGTIGGVAYKELNRTPIFGAGTDITINADGYIASFITDALDPNKLLIPAGNWNLETYFSANSGGGSPTFYVELYKYNGTTFTLIATSSGTPELIAFGTNINPYFTTLAVPETVLALTDRLALRYYVTHSGRTITLHTEDNHLCQVITTFTTGLTALNGLTTQVQFFAVGTSGTDFAISSATDTHTFNLPTASATNRGALSSADWTTFNNKTSNLGTVTSVGLSSATSGVTIGSTPVTTSGTITLAIATASGSQNGLLSSTDWTAFNSKQAAGNYVTLDTTQTITGQKTISRTAALFSGTVQSFLIDGAGAEASLTINSVTTGYAYQTFSQNGVGKMEIGIVGTGIAGGTIGSFYINKTVQTGETGASIYIKKSDGFVGINNITPTFQLDVSGTGRISGALTANTTTVTNGTRSWIISPSGASIQQEFGGVVEGKIDPSSGGNSWLGATSGTTGAGAKHYFSSTGAATFAGGVTAGGVVTITASGNSQPLVLNNQNNEQYLYINSASNREAMTQYYNATAGNWYTGIRTSAGLGTTSSYHIYSSTYGNDVFVLNTNATAKFASTVETTGIKFPATQVSSSDANTLDDYEEGTWTPTLPNGGTLTLQNARYVKIGQKVTVSFYVSSVNPTNNSAEFRFGGLPFANAGYTPSFFFGGSFGYVGTGNLNSWLPITGAFFDYIYFHANNGSAASKSNANFITDMGAGDKQIIITITYFAST
jgi:hypothetical protein